MSCLCNDHHQNFSKEHVDLAINELDRQLNALFQFTKQTGSSMDKRQFQQNFKQRVSILNKIRLLKSMKQTLWVNNIKDSLTQKKTVYDFISDIRNPETNVDIEYKVKTENYERSYHFQDRGQQQLQHIMQEFGNNVFQRVKSYQSHRKSQNQ